MFIGFALLYLKTSVSSSVGERQAVAAETKSPLLAQRAFAQEDATD